MACWIDIVWHEVDVRLVERLPLPRSWRGTGTGR